MMEPGSRAFDFIYGRWRVHNRKLRDVTDPNCEEWVEFEATSEAFPILDGIGHVDRIYVPDPPDGGPFEGFTRWAEEPPHSPAHRCSALRTASSRPSVAISC
jgi:hypothetical protein